MEMWHAKQTFTNTEHRRKELCRFVNFYNTAKLHKGLKGGTPFEVLQAYFAQPVVQRGFFLTQLPDGRVITSTFALCSY